jgi:hypothetical protein
LKAGPEKRVSSAPIPAKSRQGKADTAISKKYKNDADIHLSRCDSLGIPDSTHRTVAISPETQDLASLRHRIALCTGVIRVVRGGAFE